MSDDSVFGSVHIPSSPGRLPPSSPPRPGGDDDLINDEEVRTDGGGSAPPLGSPTPPGRGASTLVMRHEPGRKARMQKFGAAYAKTLKLKKDQTAMVIEFAGVRFMLHLPSVGLTSSRGRNRLRNRTRSSTHRSYARAKTRPHRDSRRGPLPTISTYVCFILLGSLSAHGCVDERQDVRAGRAPLFEAEVLPRGRRQELGLGKSTCLLHSLRRQEHLQNLLHRFNGGLPAGAKENPAARKAVTLVIDEHLTQSRSSIKKKVSHCLASLCFRLIIFRFETVPSLARNSTSSCFRRLWQTSPKWT